MFFNFCLEPDRSEAVACRYLDANAVSEDDCRGDAIQRQNATTPNRATVPEQDVYRAKGRRPLSRVERWIPGCFFLLYIAMLGAAVLR